MSRNRLTVTGMSAVLCLIGSSIAYSQDDSKKPVSDENPAAVTFDKVLPVLQKRCTSCHGRNDPRSGLDLTTLTGLKAGSESGPIVVAGKPDESLLYTVTAHTDGPKMPPGKDQIPGSEIKLIREWIVGGLLERGGTTTVASAGTSGSAALPMMVAAAPLTRPTAITALAVDPRNKLIAISGVQQVVLLDAQTHHPITAFPFPEGEVFALRFSADGEWLVAGGGVGAASGKVIVFEVTTGKRILETPEERDSVLSVDITSDRQFLTWGGPWRTVQVYHVETRKLLYTLSGATDWILSVGFSPDGRLVAGSDRFGGLRVWNRASGKEFWNLRGHTGAVPKLVWSPNSDHLLSIGEDETAQMWDLHTGQQTALWQLKLGGLWAADWHASNVIAIGGRNKLAVLLDQQGKLLQNLKLTDEVTKVTFTPDGSQILVADAAGEIVPFQVRDGSPIKSFSLPVTANAPRIELPWPARTRPVKDVVAKPAASSNDSPEDALLKAVLDAEEAVKTAEASLAKLRQSAARLREALQQRDAKQEK